MLQSRPCFTPSQPLQYAQASGEGVKAVDSRKLELILLGGLVGWPN